MTKSSSAEESDSFLAQGGICVQRDEEDEESFVQDTLKAGHYENDADAVRVMVRQSREIARDLVGLGVNFDRDGAGFSYTKEGAHSKARILHYRDCTGREISDKLLRAVHGLSDVTMLENSTVVDILVKNNRCCGAVIMDNKSGALENYYANVTVLATGGIGGLYAKSTNYPHLTGDALGIAMKHGVKVKNISYVQIHPTSLYTEKPGRAFLISESVRGEGAVLVDKNGNRFTDELKPRDVVTAKIYEQMKIDGMPYVRLCLNGYVKGDIKERFPSIYEHCLKEGYDITKECIPVVPAQHYFMGGIAVDLNSKTTMDMLYAVGETSCNGVHGRNRLASNSLLESLVFSKRAALHINENRREYEHVYFPDPDRSAYETAALEYKTMVLNKIREEEKGAQ